MTTLTRLNSDVGDILLTNLNAPIQDCTITMPVISGKSAYDLAVENGYVGSLQDWLTSLSGWKPIDSDFANYLEQHLQLSSLFMGVNSKIEANKAELDSRIEERINEARAINTKLENEAQERVKEANELAKQILDETTQRVSDVSKLRDDLQSEAYERALAMDQVADDILSEQVNRVNELRDLGNFIDSLDSKVNTNHTFLLEHYSTSSTTTSEIANKIDALKTTYIDPALNTKATVTAVEQVQTNISKIDGELVTVGSKLDGVIAESGKNKQDIAAIWTDMQVRVTAESALSTRIDNVVATTYEHDARIVAETKARTDADSAMASDISAITARVGTTEGKITSLEEVTNTTNSSLSQVSTKLDNLVITVDGKASSQALTDVSSRVSNAEGTLTSQGQAITKLTNDLDTTNNTVNTKASADSVSALTNRVTETEGKVTSTSNALTALTNRVITTEGDIAKKADASVLVDYYTKTKADEAIASKIEQFDANLKIGGSNLYHESLLVEGYLNAGSGVGEAYFPDAHDPNYYPCKPNEKFAGTFYDLNGVTVQGSAGYLCFYDADKNFISSAVWIVRDVFKTTYITAPLRTAYYRYATHTKGVKAKLEYGTKATDWSPSDIDIKKSIDGNAIAISGLTTRVTTAEGNITSQGTSITNLQNSVSTINNSLSTKADSSAVSTLDNKVTSIDGRTTANANSITSLQGSVETIDGKLSSKADSSALNNYYTKQDSDSAIAGKISEFKTNYVLPELGKKFDASAISAYYNKSDTESAITNKIDSFKANYVDTELNKKFNASAISDYYTIAKANEAMTNKIDSFKSTLVVGGRNLLRDSKNEHRLNNEYLGIPVGDIFNAYGVSEQEFTISFELKSDIPSGFSLYTLGKFGITRGYVMVTTEWVRYKHTFKISSIEDPNNVWSTYSIYSGYGSGAIPTIRNIKLEKGSIATDWTEAPEDIEANITNNYYTKVQANEAIASQTSDIRTTVGNHTTSIQQHSESINGIKANWSLKLNANGRVSGMTLMTDGRTSEFAIEADNFYVGAIDSAYKPFQVKTVGWTGVDGRSYPSGVYINNAIIGDLDAKVIRAGTITADKLAIGTPNNLINNFSRTNSGTGWVNYTGVNTHTSFDGTNTPCMELHTQHSVQVLSDRFKIDPAKSYEFTVWLYSEGGNTAGIDYFGLNAFDSNGTNIAVTNFDVNNPNSNSDDGNPYFWIRGHAENHRGKWVKYTGYVLAAGTDLSSIKGIVGLNVDRCFRLKSNTDSMLFRILNYYNDGTTVNHLYLAHPVVREIDTNSLIETVNNKKATNNLYYPGTTMIDGGKIQTGSITADRIQIGSLGKDNLTDDLKNTISTSASTSSQALASASTANNKIDSLEIGGANLWSVNNVVNYAGGNLGDTYPTYVGVNNYVMTMTNQGTNSNLPGNKIAIDPTKPVTISWYPVTDHTSHQIYYTTRDKDGVVVASQRAKGATKDASGRVVITIPAEEFSSAVAYLYLGLGTVSVSTYTIKNVQVEQGSKVTAWSPNPYELDNTVKDIFDDNKITPDEKQTLLVTYKQISNDNDMWRNQAYLIGLDYTRQGNATTALLSTNRPYLGWVCRNDALTQTDTLNAGERTTLMNAIAEYHAANQDLAQRVGSNLRTTGQGALQQVTNLKNEINNDNILTPPEKAYLYDRWLEIIRTNEWFNNQLSSLEVPASEKVGDNYDNWYYKVQAIISDCVSNNLNVSTTLTGIYSGAYIRDTFYTYYYYENRLKARFQEFQKQRADNAYNLANSATGIAAGARDLLNRWKANGNGTLYIDDNHIAVNKIGANEIAAGAITADHIYGGTITGDKIKSNTEINAPKIKGGEISGSEININNNFTVKPDGTLYARAGVFEGTVKASKIEGTIDVESLKSSAWMGGYTAKFYSSVNGSSTPITNTALIPSKGSIIQHYNDFMTIDKVIYTINLTVLNGVYIDYSIMRVDDEIEIVVYQNSTQYSYIKHPSYFNRDYRLYLPSGSIKIEYRLLNSSSGACGIVLLGDYIDNKNIKYA